MFAKVGTEAWSVWAKGSRKLSLGCLLKRSAEVWTVWTKGEGELRLRIWAKV